MVLKHGIRIKVIVKLRWYNIECFEVLLVMLEDFVDDFYSRRAVVVLLHASKRKSWGSKFYKNTFFLVVRECIWNLKCYVAQTKKSGSKVSLQ